MFQNVSTSISAVTVTAEDQTRSKMHECFIVEQLGVCPPSLCGCYGRCAYGMCDHMHLSNEYGVLNIGY